MFEVNKRTNKMTSLITFLCMYIYIYIYIYTANFELTEPLGLFLTSLSVCPSLKRVFTFIEIFNNSFSN